MRLIGRDHEGAFFEGPGRIEILTQTEMRYYIYGQSSDERAAFEKIIRADEHQYEALEQFRLIATDYDGVEWNGGYTTLDFFASIGKGFPITGEINSLSTSGKKGRVNPESSVEILLTPLLHLPMSRTLHTTKRIGDEVLTTTSLPGQQTITVLDAQISFSVDPSKDALWVYAQTSEKLSHPYLENWLAEPLRILLGGPVYPRAVARNLGDGRSHIWLRPSPRGTFPSATGLASSKMGLHRDPIKFWDAYRLILEYVASGGEFEANPITSLYSELSGATLGSRWVLTMTLANIIEAMARITMTEDDRASEFKKIDVDALKTHLRTFKGDTMLRERMLSSLGNFKQRSPLAYLRGLGADGVVEPEQVNIWRKIRNSVMHGEMVLPWATREDDRHLEELLGLFHRLTWLALESPDTAGKLARQH